MPAGDGRRPTAIGEPTAASDSVGSQGPVPERSGATPPQAPRPPRSTNANASRAPKRKGKIRVAIVHNVDFDLDAPSDEPGNAARAGIAHVARAIERTLQDGAHVAQTIPVDGDLFQMRERLASYEPDVVFNLCESLCGDARLESAVPLVLDGLSVPYTGSPPSALSAALYKDRVKALLHRAGVPTPESQVVGHESELRPMRYPAIVKPTREDGSIGISSTSVVYDEESCRRKVHEVSRALKQPVLIERFVKGREFNVGLFGFPSARILPLSEIDFTRLPSHLPKIVSYEAKWSEGSTEDLGTVPVTFPQLPPAIAARIRKVALEAYRALGARDYGRVDVRLSDDDGTPYVVDVNPNCDLAPESGLARAAAAVGIDYQAMMRLLVRYALRHRREGVVEVRSRRTNITSIARSSQPSLFR